MKQKQDLFLLIKSLTRTEKRHFKLFASQHIIGKVNKYVLLFDAINKQKIYDEQALIVQLSTGGKPVELLEKSISSDKNYLKRLILKSLRVYFSEKRLDNRISSLLMNARILKDKCLYDFSQQHLKKGKHLCQEFERYPQLLEILEMERQLNKEQNQLDFIVVGKKINEEKEAVLDRMKTQSALKSMDDRLFFLNKTHFELRSPAARKELEFITNSLLFNKEPDDKSFNSKFRYFLLKSNYQKLLGHNAKAASIRKQAIELWDQNPGRKKEDAVSYIVLFSNYLMLLTASQQSELALEELKKLKKLKPRTRDESAEVKQSILAIELYCYLNTANFELGMNIVPDIEKCLTDHPQKISSGRRLSIYYNLCVLHFVLEEHKGALKWAKKILSEPSKQREDIQKFAKFMSPIFKMEIERGDFLMYELRSTYRYFKNRDSLFNFENCVQHYVKKIINAANGEEEHEIYVEFDESLNAFPTGEGHPAIPGLEEIRLYLKARITGILIVDILKKME